jgi:hypothetical protein
MLPALLFLLAAASPADVGAVLDDWHQAAAVADEARFFGHFAPNGIYMGTDATERWTVSAFSEWAKPAFRRKSAWVFKSRDRHVEFSADGRTAWFDEMLDTPNMGLCRGSGVLALIAGKWKIAQYNLSVPIPNSMLNGIVKQIGEAAK